MGLSFTMEYLFEAWPLQTNLAFMGLIFGGLPVVFSQIQKPRQEDRSPANLSALAAAFFLTLVAATALSLMKAEHGPEVTLRFGLFPSMLLFLIGIMSAGTMIVPGISGTMILMMIGYYKPLLSAINQTIISLITADFSSFFTQASILLPSMIIPAHHCIALNE